MINCRSKMVTCVKCPRKPTSTLHFVTCYHQCASCRNIGIGPLKAVDHYISHYYIPPLPSPFLTSGSAPNCPTLLLMTAANPIIEPERLLQLGGFRQRRTTHLVVLCALLTLCLPRGGRFITRRRSAAGLIIHAAEYRSL